MIKKAYWHRQRRHRRAAPARSHLRPRLEPLEDRRLLALVGVGALLEFPLTTYNGAGALAYDQLSQALDIDAALVSFRESAAAAVNVTGTADLQIHILVDNAGNLAGGTPGDDLVLSGDIDLDGDLIADFSGTLLTGEVSQFGFLNISSTDRYDFRFTPTGGALASYFVGKDVGITTTSEVSSFTGDFSVSFGGGAKGNIAAIQPLLSSLAGKVYHDADNDGLVDGGETGIDDTLVTLGGTDVDGISVNLATFTDDTGAYSFTDLRPGIYQITETQPPGFVDGQDTIGTPGGTTGNDQFSGIVLAAGVAGQNNNFGELLPPEDSASLAGFVYHDADNDGIFDSGEAGIDGVTMELISTDDFGDSVSLSTLTAGGGAYRFTNLRAGIYQITETQPAGFLDGIDTIGTPGGTSGNDQFSGIDLAAGVAGQNNNFGELVPPEESASLAGCVYLDIDNDGIADAGEIGLAGVRVVLSGTDRDGNSVNLSTTTGSGGLYSFPILRPGTYSLSQVQPADLLDGKDRLGTLGGVASNDQFSQIVLSAGAAGTDYCFGERALASVSKQRLLASTSIESVFWVDALYRNVLGRPGSVDEIFGWVGAIDGGTSFRSVADAFLFSTERRTGIVEALYQQYLGRAADDGGIQHWLQVWNRSGLEVVQASIIGSAEFHTFAGGTEAAWVASLYQNVLGRAAGQAEVDYWTGRLATQSRFEVVLGMLTSDEYRLSRIAGWYRDYLGREADGAGLEHWLEQLRRGTSQESIQATLLASVEGRLRWA